MQIEQYDHIHLEILFETLSTLRNSDQFWPSGFNNLKIFAVGPWGWKHWGHDHPQPPHSPVHCTVLKESLSCTKNPSLAPKIGKFSCKKNSRIIQAFELGENLPKIPLKLILIEPSFRKDGLRVVWSRKAFMELFDEIAKDYKSFWMAMVRIMKLGNMKPFEYVVTLASTMSEMRTPAPAPAQLSMDASVPLRCQLDHRLYNANDQQMQRKVMCNQFIACVIWYQFLIKKSLIYPMYDQFYCYKSCLSNLLVCTSHVSSSAFLIRAGSRPQEISECRGRSK